MSAAESRPWPVVLMTALGAWLAAVPLTAMIFIALGPVLREGPGLYAIGALLLVASLFVLRRPSLPLFLEQLAVPGLLVGGLCLGYALFKDLPDALAAALLALGMALGIERPWLRVLLGAAAAALALRSLDGAPWDSWLALHALFGVWVLALLLVRARPLWSALIAPIAVGWLLFCLLDLALMASGHAPGGAQGAQQPVFQPIASALLAVAAAAWAARAWRGLRQPWLLAVALVLIGLAALMPSLGAALFALAVVACRQHWRLAAAAALAAVWIVGSFYYQLHWPLAQKALWLAGAGALLGGLAAWQLRGTRAAVARREKFGLRQAAFITSALLTLAVANGAIWQKERLIADGVPVFVALAPVDPRSLMQGDYMRLRFALPEDVSAPLLGWHDSIRPRLVARLDAATRIATPLRLERDRYDKIKPPAVGEILLELTPRDGRWMLVTDAWFFKEGEAKRFAAARFGEFRVGPDGRALLVGVADEKLQPIRP